MSTAAGEPGAGGDAPHDPTALPADLPRPLDDGAADHLPGAQVPHVVLVDTDGQQVDLAALAGRSIVYAYPRTGQPGQPPLDDDWDLIPGARGCTPQACSFRDHHAELTQLGTRVFGLSTQDTPYQAEAVDRLHLPFALLSDEHLSLTTALGLPTFTVAGQRLLRRLTLLVRDGRVEHVWYPVFPPDTHAAEVVAWLTEHPEDPAAAVRDGR
jgi:peroxiredoxin